MNPTTHLDENPTWAQTDACTLPTAERPLRMAEFDALFATSLRAVDRRDDTRARLLLAGDATLADRTQRLADAEASCCSFFTFGVTAVGTGEVAFDIAVPPAYVAVLTGLVTRAERSLGDAT